MDQKGRRAILVDFWWKIVYLRDISHYIVFRRKRPAINNAIADL